MRGEIEKETGQPDGEDWNLSLRRDALTYYRAHYLAGRSWETRAFVIGTLSAMLASIAGATVVKAGSAPNQKIAGIDLSTVAGGAALVSGALTGYVTLSKPGDRAAEHFKYSAEYLALLTKLKEQKPSAAAALAQKQTELFRNAPSLPKWAFQSSKEAKWLDSFEASVAADAEVERYKRAVSQAQAQLRRRRWRVRRLWLAPRTALIILGTVLLVIIPVIILLGRPLEMLLGPRNVEILIAVLGVATTLAVEVVRGRRSSRPAGRDGGKLGAAKGDESLEGGREE